MNSPPTEKFPANFVSNNVDAVVIGRNEETRLGAGLASLRDKVRTIVYVDSGSTDSSVLLAKQAGAVVVHLDTAVPFTAARARNAGIKAIQNLDTAPDFIQFMDGDCSIDDRWIGFASEHLNMHPRLAAVCGRRRERYPERSVYNLLCDWEWDTPIGLTRACGGDILIRFSAIVEIGGYRNDVIAAEDDEMCQRLIKNNWQLERLDHEMTLHDAAILHFSQWWQRAVRAGHGFAQVSDLHPNHFSQAVHRVLLWAVGAPLAGIIGALFIPWLLIAILLLYVASFTKIFIRFYRNDMRLLDSMKCALLLVLSKLPNLQGMLTWRWRRSRGHQSTIIEYK